MHKSTHFDKSISFIMNYVISNFSPSLLLLLLIGVRCARPGENENTLLGKRPQPHKTNPWKEEKDKTVGDKTTDATDRRWARLHSKSPPARKLPLLTTLSSSLISLQQK